MYYIGDIGLGQRKIYLHSSFLFDQMIIVLTFQDLSGKVCRLLTVNHCVLSSKYFLDHYTGIVLRK